VKQALPQVPQKALDTITGRVRVAVRARVDESGNVTGATLESSGPSKYFARLALQAAEDWKFTPSQSGSDPQPSTWILRFTFTSAAVDATASPAR
jgi:TonB family protein